MQEIIFTGEYTDLNTYSTAERLNRYAAAEIKDMETTRAYADCLVSGVKQINKPVFIVFKWYVKDKKKDKDNISFAKKFIIDGMVQAHVLKNDGYKQIVGFMDVFGIDKQYPKVIAYLFTDIRKIPFLKYAVMSRKNTT